GAVEGEPLQRSHERAVADGAGGKCRKRRLDRHAQERARLVLGVAYERRLRGIDDAEKERDLLVGEARRRQIDEQLDQQPWRHADFLKTFAPRRLARRFVRFDVAGDYLDEIASAVGKLRRQTKLADENDFAAIKVDRSEETR